MEKKIYKGWELLKEITEGNITEGTIINIRTTDDMHFDVARLEYTNERLEHIEGREIGTHEFCSDKYCFEIIEEQEEIKWKPILEYNRENYDWVLVKYFDKDYECIPDVAEMRADGKWYNRSDREIPFEVKYFFDMQLLNKGE